MASQILASSKARVARVAVSKSKKSTIKARITIAKKHTGCAKIWMGICLKGLKRFLSTASHLHQAVGRLSLRAFLLRKAAARLEKRNRREIKLHRSDNRHMYKMLNLIQPELEFSVSFPATLEKIASEAARVARYNKKLPLANKEIETTLRLLMTGELTKFTVRERTKERHDI